MHDLKNIDWENGGFEVKCNWCGSENVKFVRYREDLTNTPVYHCKDCLSEFKVTIKYF